MKGVLACALVKDLSGIYCIQVSAGFHHSIAVSGTKKFVCTRILPALELTAILFNV